MYKVLPSDSRTHNRSLILRALFHDGPSSRADLARLTGLTKVTVSDLVNELIEGGLIVEAGPQIDQKAGKTAMLVSFCTDSTCVIVIDLFESEQINGAIADLDGAFWCVSRCRPTAQSANGCSI